MRRDIPQVAFNLLTSLPVRTHYQPPEPERQYLRPRKMPGAGGGKMNRPVEILGIKFASISDAQRHFKVGHTRCLSMVKANGRFLEADDDLS